MRAFSGAITLCVFASAAATQSSPANPVYRVGAGAVVGQSARSAAADALLAPMLPTQPGAVVLVTQGGKTVYARAYGAADLEQGTTITADTRFHAASVSKQFTAMALAMLARDGKVDLDADIHTYLPELPDFKARIRVVDLLHHTSGLRDQWELLVASGNDMQSLLTQNAILSLVRAQRDLNFPPNSEFRYSNTGYTLAAEIVARVSGVPFRQFVHDRIFVPVGMSNSLIYDNAAEIVPRRAQSYAITAGGKIEHRRLNYSNYGATSLTTTVADLQKWLQEVQHPMVFDSSLIRSLYQPNRLTGGTWSNYGLGMWQSEIRGHNAIMHTGSDAGFRALVATYPTEDTSIIILSNGSADLTPVHEGLVDIFLNGTTDPAAVVQPSATDLARLPGYYASSWGGAIELKASEGKLTRVSGGSALSATFRSNNIIEFPSPVTRYRIAAGSGTVDTLEQLTNNGPPVRYERVERTAVAVDALRTLTGRYRSTELDITYVVSMANDKLTMANLQAPDPVPLTPVKPDWLDFPNGRLIVERDDQGSPVAILLTTSRSRNMRLYRVSDDAK